MCYIASGRPGGFALRTAMLCLIYSSRIYCKGREQAMGARTRSLWQRIKQHPVATVLISLSALLVVLVILGGYKFNWDWTGFNGNNKSGKTLWDWMQLLFIPVVLAVAGFWFNHREGKIEQQGVDADLDVSFDNYREYTLQTNIAIASD